MRRRYDIVARLGALRDDILSGTLDRSRSTPSDYDVWIDRRLRDGADQTALAKNPLSAAAPFCKLLGQALLRQHDLPDDAPTACFYDAGFAVARQGEAAIRAALDGLAATATRHLDLPPTVFGPLFSKPAWDAAVVATLRPFMSILRECVLDHWPIDPGTMLLGEEVAQRRLHSLSSASREIGVSIPVIRRFLARTGAIDPNIDLPPSRVVFDAQAQSGLLADLPHFVGPKAMCAAIGATSFELTALQAAGVLAPLSADPDIRKSWLISDGAALVEELGAGAEPVGKGDPAWETLLRGCRRTGRGMREIVDAIRSGRVRSGCREGATGFHAIVVRKRDFDTLSAARAEDAAEDAEDISRMTSAAVFGRTLGLHNTSDFGGFVAAGHTPARQIRNPKTLRMQVFLTDDDVTAFHRRFVTIASLEAETGCHRNTLRGLLPAARIARVRPGGRDFGPIYLRADVEAALPSLWRQ